MKKRNGFTLMEVLVATAIAGLTITAGFRLVAMSVRLLSEARAERELISAGERILLSFRNDDDMAESGTEDGVHWETTKMSSPVDEFELKFRRVTVNLEGSGHSMYIYIAE